MKTTKFTLAASALILTMSAAGAANAATCASAINSLQANVDVSALNADDRADYNSELDAAMDAQTNNNSEVCLERVAELEERFGTEAQADMIENQLDRAEDRAEMMEDRMEERNQRLEERADRLEERAEERADAREDRMEDRMDNGTSYSASSGVNADADISANANNMANINTAANTSTGSTVIVDDIDGQTIYNSANGRVGTVNRVVSNSASGDTYAVVERGGILGFGAKEYLVPTNQISMNGDAVTVSNLSGTDMDSYTRLTNDVQTNYVTLNSDQNVDGIVTIGR